MGGGPLAAEGTADVFGDHRDAFRGQPEEGGQGGAYESGPWLESYTVRVPASASQWAVAACGSIGWLCSGGTEYAQSTRTGAAANAAAASPVSRWAG